MKCTQPDIEHPQFKVGWDIGYNKGVNSNANIGKLAACRKENKQLRERLAELDSHLEAMEGHHEGANSG